MQRTRNWFERSGTSGSLRGTAHAAGLTGKRRMLVAALGLGAAIAARSAAAAPPETPPSAPPSAADLQRARDLFVKGAAAEQAGKFGESCELFGRVAAIKPSASVRFHLGVCEAKLGHLVAAQRHFEQARTLAQMENKPEVLTAVVAPLEELARKLPKLRVEVGASAATARVLLDDRELSAAELAQPFGVDPGRHVLRAETKRGDIVRERFRREFVLAEGERQSVAVELAAEPAGTATATPTAPVAAIAPPATNPAPPNAATQGPSKPAVATGRAATTSTNPSKNPPAATASAPPNATPSSSGAFVAARPFGQQPTAPRSADSPSRWPAVVTTTLSLAAIGGGIWSVVHAGDLASSARRDCPTKLNCDDERRAVRTWDTLAIGGFALGAALGALSIHLWLRGPSEPAASSATGASTSAPTRGSASLSIGPARIAFGGTF